MPKIPDEQKPAIGKVIAPTALFWFRWAALFTVVSGLILAVLNGYAHQAFTLQVPFRAIGLGMWIALVMAFNVWFIIWPNQKRALGIVAVEPDVKAVSACCDVDFTFQYYAFCTNVIFDGCSITQLNLVCYRFEIDRSRLEKGLQCGPFLIPKSV